MLNIVSHEVSLNDGYLELSVGFKYDLEEDDEAVGLQYYAKVSDADGSMFVTPVETALLTASHNESSILKSFQCPPSFVGKKVTVHYRAYFPEDGGVIDIGAPEKNSIKLLSNPDDGKWDAGSVSTVVVNDDDGSADLLITLECRDPNEWGWMVTPMSGDNRGHEVFEPFKGIPVVTIETNTYELDHGIQLDVAFLRAGPPSEASIDI
jgi:hypothetical protein